MWREEISSVSLKICNGTNQYLLGVKISVCPSFTKAELKCRLSQCELSVVQTQEAKFRSAESQFMPAKWSELNHSKLTVADTVIINYSVSSSIGIDYEDDNCLHLRIVACHFSSILWRNRRRQYIRYARCPIRNMAMCYEKTQVQLICLHGCSIATFEIFFSKSSSIVSQAVSKPLFLAKSANFKSLVLEILRFLLSLQSWLEPLSSCSYKSSTASLGRSEACRSRC